MSCQRVLSVLLQFFLRVLMLKCKPCCKLPNIEVAELAVWSYDDTKACCVLQANSCHLKSERAWAIYLTPRLRKQKCAARPGRPRCGGWQKSMCNRALTWMHPICADKWEKTWPIKVELAWESTQNCPSTLICLSAVKLEKKKKYKLRRWGLGMRQALD